MTWLQRYRLHSFVRSSVWLPPVIGLIAALVLRPVVQAADEALGGVSAVGPDGARAGGGELLEVDSDGGEDQDEQRRRCHGRGRSHRASGRPERMRLCGRRPTTDTKPWSPSLGRGRPRPRAGPSSGRRS